MRTTAFDLSPLFRTSIGFDRMSRLLDSAARIEDNALSYPPYNIEQVGEHKYSITMALAGFSEEDLDLQVHEGTLTVKSKPHDVSNEKDRKFLHRGIAARASSGSSISPSTSKWWARISRMACCGSIWSGSCPTRRSRARSPFPPPCMAFATARFPGQNGP